MIQADELGAYTLADDEFLDVQSITDAMMTSAQSLTELAIRFFLNLAVCWILVHFFYYRKSRRRDYYFTFMVFSSAMLMLLYMMGNVEVGVGLTLGLFAIFGVIRYRTETVPIREMTYLFVIIALAAMNGLAPIYKVLPEPIMSWTGARQGWPSWPTHSSWDWSGSWKAKNSCGTARRNSCSMTGSS